MPRTRSLAWAELKIGLVSLFAIVMALVLIFLLSGEGGFSWQQYGLKAVFPSVPGLKPGAPVRVAGVEVGSVERRRPDRRPRRRRQAGEPGSPGEDYQRLDGIARVGLGAR